MTIFEQRYRAEADPWRTLSDPYELEKAERALEACGPGPFAAACDLGAGIGAMTARLAPRCARLLALDAAPTAVAAARDRLAGFPHAEARVAALPAGLPAERFDLVVASEVLYYLAGPDLEATAAWLGDALVAGGRAVTVHWTGRAPDLRLGAEAIHETLSRTVRPVATEARPGYRIDLYEQRP